MMIRVGPSLADRFDRWLKDRQTWNLWFAWRPVRLTNTEHYVWLEPVWRRVHDGCGYYRTWTEYATQPPPEGRGG